MPTKKQIEEQLKHESRLSYLWSQAYIDERLRVKPVATETWSDDVGGHHTVRLFEVARSHGGYVVTSFAFPGQRDSYGVEYFDDWCHRHHPALESRIASEQLQLARHKALHPEEVEP